MKFRFDGLIDIGDESIYSDDEINSIIKKAKRRSKKLDCYFITLPLTDNGYLEIYWYPELLKKLYKKIDAELFVVGITETKEEAIEFVTRMFEENDIIEAGISPREYFKELL